VKLQTTMQPLLSDCPVHFGQALQRSANKGSFLQLTAVGCKLLLVSSSYYSSPLKRPLHARWRSVRKWQTVVVRKNTDPVLFTKSTAFKVLSGDSLKKKNQRGKPERIANDCVRDGRDDNRETQRENEL